MPMACKIRSTVIYLSPDFSAKFKALSSIFAKSPEIRSCPAPPPVTLGNFAKALLTLAESFASLPPADCTRRETIASSSSNITRIMCSGSREGWFDLVASVCACCKNVRDFSVNFSKSIVKQSFMRWSNNDNIITETRRQKDNKKGR